MNQILTPEFGAALAVYGSDICYMAAGFAILMLAWSAIDRKLQAMERAQFLRIEKRASNDLEMDCAEPMVADTVRLYSGGAK